MSYQLEAPALMQGSFTDHLEGTASPSGPPSRSPRNNHLRVIACVFQRPGVAISFDGPFTRLDVILIDPCRIGERDLAANHQP